MRLKDLVREAYENAKENGFHDVPGITFGDRIALIHSELSEALEAYRSNDDGYTHGPFDKLYSRDGKLTRDPGFYDPGHTEDELVPNKPEGVWSEMADVVIRVADLCGLYGIDLEDAIIRKMRYNATRPKLHGKKF